MLLPPPRGGDGLVRRLGDGTPLAGVEFAVGDTERWVDSDGHSSTLTPARGPPPRGSPTGVVRSSVGPRAHGPGWGPRTTSPRACTRRPGSLSTTPGSRQPPGARLARPARLAGTHRGRVGRGAGAGRPRPARPNPATPRRRRPAPAARRRAVHRTCGGDVGPGRRGTASAARPRGAATSLARPAPRGPARRRRSGRRAVGVGVGTPGRGGLVLRYQDVGRLPTPVERAAYAVAGGCRSPTP